VLLFAFSFSSFIKTTFSKLQMQTPWSEAHIYLFIYLFIYLALPTRAGSPQQHMPITVGPLVPNPPGQLYLWEETGVPGENPRLSAER
jgi:hypothetical protein